MTYQFVFCLLRQNLIRTIGLVALGLVLSTHGARAQGRPEYRDFQLGADLLTVSGLAKVSVSEAKTTHVRPALMQDLEWRPSYVMSGSAAAQTDPVKRVVFSFYNDQLFRVVVDYDRERTRGMTAADLIDAISTEYGPPLPPAAARTRAVVSSLEMESGRR